MDIPREFSKLTHAQLVYFAKAGFDVYWDFVDSLMKDEELNSTMQRISKDVAEMQKIINKQNQKVNENNDLLYNPLHQRADQEGFWTWCANRI